MCSWRLSCGWAALTCVLLPWLVPQAGAVRAAAPGRHQPSHAGSAATTQGMACIGRTCLWILWYVACSDFDECGCVSVTIEAQPAGAPCAAAPGRQQPSHTGSAATAQGVCVALGNLVLLCTTTPSVWHVLRRIVCVLQQSEWRPRCFIWTPTARALWQY
jgi:hypothetical protein